MRATIRIIIASTLLALSLTGLADTEVYLPDGRRAVLHDDFSWEYSDNQGEAKPDNDGGAGDGITETDDATKHETGKDAGDSATAATVIEAPAVLAVTQRKPLLNSCKFGLTLTNRLPTKIRNIVPQFLAYTADDVMYQRVFQAWSNVRPTRHQYREIEFNGISCDEIAYIKVSGAGRCEIGDLNKFSSTDEECLAYIEVAESKLVEITKDLDAAIGSE